MIKDQTALPEGSNAHTPHPSRLTQILRLHGLSPHALTTTLRERRERERSAIGWAPHVVGRAVAVVTAAAAAVGVVQRGQLRGHLVR